MKDRMFITVAWEKLYLLDFLRWFRNMLFPIHKKSSRNIFDRIKREHEHTIISSSFIWCLTPEGQIFWSKLNTIVRKNELDKKQKK